jgi:pimeloyl-ACP methyl ester carboxylesterase
VKTWQLAATALNSVPEAMVQSIFPWCLTPETYTKRPEYIQALSDFVRSRPPQPLAAFQQQCNAVMMHDADSLLEFITAPTQITFGSLDMLTSSRFANAIKAKIKSSEVFVFENCSHGTLYENVEEFNKRTLEFLRGRAMSQAA